jgi:hypothetical protein
MMGPRRKMDDVAAEMRASDPMKYARWKRAMIQSAIQSIRSYRSDAHHTMTFNEFREHMLRGYSTEVVNEAFAETGPRLVSR